tara:strand:+ start:3130 stop:3504 length:375 start_codon:yes stop_codon:yes gene_type:complete
MIYEEADGSVIEQWKDEYGGVTSYSFMVYSPISIKDNAIINEGLTVTLMEEGYVECRYIQLMEDVDKKAAEMYNLSRGWSIQWIFPGELDEEIAMVIVKTIEEGLQFLKLHYQFLGSMGGEQNV